ncbi:hypothetical protein IAU59_000442 [Kwoniella sp. CBS 9459]
MYRHRFRSQPQPHRPVTRIYPTQQGHDHATITTLSSTGSDSASNDDGHEVDVTLSSPHKHSPKSRGTADAAPRPHGKSNIEVAHIEHFDGQDVTALSPTTSSSQTSYDTTDNASHPARPRLGGKGVGAVVRHLGVTAARGGRGSGSAGKTGGTSRWLNYTKGFLHPFDSENDDHHDSASISAVEEAIPTEYDIGKISTRTSGQTNPNQAERHVNTRPMPSATPAPIVATNTVKRRNPLPDLTRVAPPNYVASLIASPPSASNTNGRPATRTFALTPPPYTDDDIPTPKPYNLAYPHPLTAYASPGVNPETVKASGYGELLDRLIREDLQYAVGSILYEAGFRSVESSVYLLFSFGGSNGCGNGIPESLWSKLENANPTARLPVGIAGVSPFAASGMNPELTAPDLPPRFSQLQHQQYYSQAMNHGLLTPASSVSESDYFTPGQGPDMTHQSLPDFDSTPRPSPGHAPVRSALSVSRLRGPAAPNAASQPARGHQDVRNESEMRTGGSNVYNQASTRYQAPLTPPHSQQSGISPFYKTELCAMWDHMGKCKYGGQCQYAHGFEDLRLPRHLQPRNEVSLAPAVRDVQDPWANHDNPSHSEGIMYPSSRRATHSRSYAPLRDRSQDQQRQPFEPRRASCPPQQLFPLAEADSHTTCDDRRNELMRTTPAPIGSERSATMPYTHRSSGISALKSVPAPPAPAWTEADMPPFRLVSEPRHMSIYTDSTAPSSFLRSEASTLSLSLSTSSGSRFSTYTNYDDCEADRAETHKVAEDDLPTIGISGGHGHHHTLATSTSLDFSTGKSIWR